MVIVEENKRLSESVLWELQLQAYTQFGPDAWAQKGVPFYLTSNPLIAKQFSAVILGFLTDISIDHKEPFYIFDLGAGSGRLGYLILKHLLPKVKRCISPDLKVCYVMTDMVKKNLEFWKSHSFLKPFIEEGSLDFAHYVHSDKSPLTLQVSGKRLEKVVNPIALVCTYYFDTIPQDLFMVKDGVLHEGRVSLSLEKPVKKITPDLIPDLEAKYDFVQCESPKNYNSEMNDLLNQYGEIFKNTPFLFPVGGLHSLEYFSDLSRNRLLMVAGDQGVATEEQVREWGEPKISRHASFSMAVSYHLLAKYFENKEGVGLLTRFHNPKYVVMCGILGESQGNFPRTSLAFREEIDFFEPVDYWELTSFKPEELEKMSLDQLLLYVKLGNWDPINFHVFYFEILKQVSQATNVQKENLYQAILCVYENFYPVHSQEGDFIMNLGVLLFELEKYEEAIRFFIQAKEIAGENPKILKNLSKCYQALNNPELAKKFRDLAISHQSKNISK